MGMNDRVARLIATPPDVGTSYRRAIGQVFFIINVSVPPKLKRPMSAARLMPKTRYNTNSQPIRLGFWLFSISHRLDFC